MLRELREGPLVLSAQTRASKIIFLLPSFFGAMLLWVGFKLKQWFPFGFSKWLWTVLELWQFCNPSNGVWANIEDLTFSGLTWVMCVSLTQSLQILKKQNCVIDANWMGDWFPGVCCHIKPNTMTWSNSAGETASASSAKTKVLFPGEVGLDSGAD